MRIFVVAALLLLPIAALAQQVQPVMLSPQEYQAVITELMGRDAVIRLLTLKQDQQQAQAAKDAAAKEKDEPAAKEPAKPEPHHPPIKPNRLEMNPPAPPHELPSRAKPTAPPEQHQE